MKAALQQQQQHATDEICVIKELNLVSGCTCAWVHKTDFGGNIKPCRTISYIKYSKFHSCIHTDMRSN